MRTTKTALMLLTLVLLSFNSVMGQATTSGNLNDTSGEIYLLERELNDTSDENLQNIATSAQATIEKIGPQVEWVHSYVTDNRMICVFKYENRNAMREHAEKAGLKPGELKKVERKIGPEYARH